MTTWDQANLSISSTDCEIVIASINSDPLDIIDSQPSPLTSSPMPDIYK